MLLRSILRHCLSVPCLLVVSSLAQASGTATVVVGPLATSVPTLSGILLIVLGMLLAVIAFRTLPNNEGAQRLLSILVLGGGLIISGVGVDRTLAVPDTLPASGGVCTQAGPLPSYYPYVDIRLQNDCGNSIQIIDFRDDDCPIGLDEDAANCKRGQVLTSGSSCSFLPKCAGQPG